MPKPVDSGGYFDHTTHAVARDFRRQAVLALERIGISVEFSHHEVAPGQQEIDLRYADALTTADNIMTFRHVVKEVALSNSVHATFMPKPFTDQPGSGMHTHLSLFEGERNAFHDASDPMKLSKVAQAFIAGLLLARPGVHRRHQPVGQLLQAALPAGAAGPDHRGAGVRLLGAPQPLGAGAGAGLRQAELGPGRGPLARQRLQPVPRLRGHARRRPEGHRGGLRAAARAPRTTCGRCRRAERRAMGYESLPENLAEAIDVMARSELVAEVLGEHVFDFFLRNKRSEWEDYRRVVTPYERQRYLGSL